MNTAAKKQSPGRAYGGESSEQRDARRRRQILDAGMKTFGTEGFRAATVRGVCAEARVADRNFYENFSSLEELLIAVYRECAERMMTEVIKAVGEIHQEMEIEPAVERGLDAFFAIVEDPILARIVWREVLGVSPLVEDAYVENMKVFADFLTGLLQAWRPSSERSAETYVLATTTVGGLSNMAMIWSLDGYKPEREVIVSVASKLVVAVSGIAQQ